MDWMMNCGTAMAFLGGALAVGLSCAGSAKGVGIVGSAAAGALSEDPGRFSQVLILQILPVTDCSQSHHCRTDNCKMYP